MIPPHPLAELSVDSQRVTSHTNTSISSSPNTSEPESHHSPPLHPLDPGVVAVMNSFDEHNTKFELPALDESPTSPKKPETHDVGTVDTKSGSTTDSPISPLPNPYEIALGPRELDSRPYSVTAPSLVEFDDSSIQRLPSVLRPAHPKFAHSTDSRRGTMLFGGLEFGLPPPVVEDGRLFILENGKPFTLDGRRRSTENLVPFPTEVEVGPHATARQNFFPSENRISFPSSDGGVNAGSHFFEVERIRRHSEVATSSATLPVPRHAHHASFSSPLSNNNSPEVEYEGRGSLKPSQTPHHIKGQSIGAPLNVSGGFNQKKSARWKFWSKKSSKA